MGSSIRMIDEVMIRNKDFHIFLLEFLCFLEILDQFTEKNGLNSFTPGSFYHTEKSELNSFTSRLLYYTQMDGLSSRLKIQLVAGW